MRLKTHPGRRGSNRVWPVLALLALLAFGLAIAPGCGNGGRTEVILQLNWYHEAEFAGYYMADAKGFYGDHDLEVTIVEGGPQAPARNKVLDGTATFAICSFAEQRQMVDNEEPVVSVMAAFQIPPLVIFSLESSGIKEPADLVGRTVGVTTKYWQSILEQTLEAAGLDPATVSVLRVEPDRMDLLYDGEVDAWLGYAQDEPIKAQTDGHPVKNIFPADFGVGGYEGLLIARQGTIDSNPEMVERFVKATYEGWRYAVENQEETAKVLAKWAPKNGLEFHRLAIRAVVPLVDTPQVPVGWIDQGRWRQMMGTSWQEARPGFSMEYSPVAP